MLGKIVATNMPTGTTRLVFLYFAKKQITFVFNF